MTRAFGYRPDPPKLAGEKQDFDASHKFKAGPIPQRASNVDLTKVIDQFGVGSCVENASGQLVRMSHIKQGAIDPPFSSRLFGYYLDRAAEGLEQVDSGTYIRLSFANKNKFGFCAEAEWPYVDDGETFKRKPSPAAFRAAFDQKSPTEYSRIYESGADRILAVKRAVAAGYGIAFGTQVSMRFSANDLGFGPVAPPIGEPSAGGHAMAIVGYDGNVFDVINSWGTGWGDGGYWKMSADYLVWDETNDLWICQAAPLFSGGVGA